MIKSEQKHSHVLEILAFEQNWNCKHKVGHCYLTLLCFFLFFFFYFHNFEYQGSINVSVKFMTNYI